MAITLIVKTIHKILWSFKAINGYAIHGAFIPFYFISSRAVTEIAKALIRKLNIKSFCDVGSGSGYIAIEILKEFNYLYAVAIDIDENSTIIAKVNGKSHGVFDRLDVVQCPSGKCLRKKSFDIALSNPPYLPCPSTISTMLCSGVNEDVYIDILLQIVRTSKQFAIISSSSLAKVWRVVANIFKEAKIFTVKAPVDEVKILLLSLDNRRRLSSCEQP